MGAKEFGNISLISPLGRFEHFLYFQYVIDMP
jgi:hypothetical protein